jgi:hypothetical protein
MALRHPVAQEDTVGSADTLARATSARPTRLPHAGPPEVQPSSTGYDVPETHRGIAQTSFAPSPGTPPVTVSLSDSPSGPRSVPAADATPQRITVDSAAGMVMAIDRAAPPQRRPSDARDACHPDDPTWTPLELMHLPYPAEGPSAP